MANTTLRPLEHGRDTRAAVSKTTNRAVVETGIKNVLYDRPSLSKRPSLSTETVGMSAVYSFPAGWPGRRSAINQIYISLAKAIDHDKTKVISEENRGDQRRGRRSIHRSGAASGSTLA